MEVWGLKERVPRRHTSQAGIQALRIARPVSWTVAWRRFDDLWGGCFDRSPTFDFYPGKERNQSLLLITSNLALDFDGLPHSSLTPVGASSSDSAARKSVSCRVGESEFLGRWSGIVPRCHRRGVLCSISWSKPLDQPTFPSPLSHTQRAACGHAVYH